MATTTKPPPMNLKLLIDKSSGKVLFAEAKKEFVDFLFALLQAPLGSLLRLLSENGMPTSSGSLDQLYTSVLNLDPNYFLPNINKLTLIPKMDFPPNTHHVPSFPPPKESNSGFTLGSSSPSTFSTSTPPLFGNQSNYSTSSPFGSSCEVVPGYVKDVVTYMVLDDLTVQPSSNISILILLNKFHVKEVGCLQEKNVKINLQKGIELVKASFQSDSVLTDVFNRTTTDNHQPSSSK
ncbi:hypothetical protein Tsubulata_050645 [Turnera subulata]|uniref:DUF674 domain-containing protein n=1 Tax=Turnera subulata TaxID=218843 RepID=A0A9Q0G625_9ROSI|nr:hypothetical protein Tsubulata_050645 [Turnera subulata]